MNMKRKMVFEIEDVVFVARQIAKAIKAAYRHNVPLTRSNMIRLLGDRFERAGRLVAGRYHFSEVLEDLEKHGKVEIRYIQGYGDCIFLTPEVEAEFAHELQVDPELDLTQYKLSELKEMVWNHSKASKLPYTKSSQKRHFNYGLKDYNLHWRDRRKKDTWKILLFVANYYKTPF